MTILRTSIPVALATVLVSSPIGLAQSVPELLEKGIYAEETAGDLDAAITIYEQIVAEASKNRAYAAQAQYRLGMCRLKQGQEDKAIMAFRRLIDRYPQQAQFVARARSQLSVLGGATAGLVRRQVWSPSRADPEASAVSPDGRYITFVNWDTGNLAVHDCRTGKDRDVTSAGTWDRPSKFCDASIWSPDGSKIAYFWIDRATGKHLQIIDLEGSAPRVVASSETPTGFAPWPRSWSGDGKYILAIHARANEDLEQGVEGQLVMVTIADGSIRVLRSLGGQFCQFASLSPDGRYVAYELEAKRGSGKRDIRLLATDGSTDVALVDHPADDGVPIWTPDGDGILFVSNRSGSKALWSLAVADGKPKGEPLQVVEMGARSAPLGIADDGTFYYSVAVPDTDVYTATLDGQAVEIQGAPEKRSLRFEGSNYSPFWSPGGDWLGYASKRTAEEPFVLVIQSATTGEERVFAPDGLRMMGAHLQRPQWSPTGGTILVAGQAGGVRGHFLVDVETQEFVAAAQDREEAEEHGAFLNHPVFSPDGKQIYFIRGSSIMALDLATQQKREIHGTAEYVQRLACSPDGQALAFFTGAHAVTPTKVVTIPVAGGDPVVLCSLDEGARFREDGELWWTPDGSHVIVGKRAEKGDVDELWMIPVTGGEPRVVALGCRADHLALHPGGKQIAFSAGEYTSEVWALENLPDPTREER